MPPSTAARLSLVLSLLSAGPAAAACPQEPAPPLRFGDPLELAYAAPFFPGASYDPAVPTPDATLGQLHGTRLARHAEVLGSLRAIAAASPRVTEVPMGVTHEGRELAHFVVTSERNHARLDEVLGAVARLADPRGLDDADAERLVADTPAVAWLGYSIHGDELSGTDASMAVAYHLAASTDDDVRALLEALVVVIDPCQNPDGRERIIGMVEQSAGYTPNLDYASMQRGRWPYGRGNHYLFDMNRDWMAGTQPETRARWKAIRRYHPQLVVDAHEMGGLDTFLFYPQAEPLHPARLLGLEDWQGVLADDAARAFDRYGWSYYTREWADGWAPFYTDAWASLVGAIGILYEQAGFQGFPLRRASGEVVTYREAVHHQAVASLANLGTLAARRADVLANYLANQRRNVAADTPGNDRVMVLELGVHPTRERELVSILLDQGVELFRAERGFEARDAESVLGARAETLAVPAGALVVSPRQPMGQVVRAFLEREQRMDLAALKSEREELERKGESKVYDVTSWCLPQAFGLDAWWCAATDAPLARLEAPPPVDTGVRYATDGTADAPTAFVVDGIDDGSVAFAARAMELGLAVNVSDRAFGTGRERFARGSLLVRRAENPGPVEELVAKVERAARAAGVVAWATETGRSTDEGPDLGGQRFRLLARPRVALLGNAPVSSSRYGHLWHHLDTRLGLPFSILDAQQLGGVDLRRFNVLVLPPGGVEDVLAPLKDELARWVEDGGTLVACGGAAFALTRERLGLARAVRRRDVLEELDAYARVARRQRAAREVEIDERLLWDGVASDASGEDGGEGADASDDEAAEEDRSEDDADTEDAEELDAWRRRFAPSGVTLLAEASPEAWITAGFEGRLPVDFGGASVLLSKEFAAVRFAPAEELRLGGLLWPEARERLADSAYLVVERHGRGAVVLFADAPAFRGTQRVTARLFSNAVVYGPGLGASQPLGW